MVRAAGLHLLYITGSFGAMDRLRPVNVFDIGEPLGAAAFVAIGLAELAFGGVSLGNVLPAGMPGNLFSSGSVALLNIAVGVEVRDTASDANGGAAVYVMKACGREIGTLLDRGTLGGLPPDRR